MYEKHPDGSGVMFSSRRRPVLQLRPGADGWNFTPDTDINAFLKHVGVGHDVIADEDLHTDGLDALAPYRVIVTGTHPEYWSTAMLDALEQWQRAGGRLIYLGGNGFYWRVAFSDEWPGAMELRRAEDGVRNWQTESGENYHAFTGEYGGLWRRNGRAPNELVGVGFAAQGFLDAAHYEINESSRESRAAWIWEGVDDDDGKIGTSGLGGGSGWTRTRSLRHQAWLTRTRRRSGVGNRVRSRHGAHQGGVRRFCRVPDTGPLCALRHRLL